MKKAVEWIDLRSLVESFFVERATTQTKLAASHAYQDSVMAIESRTTYTCADIPHAPSRLLRLQDDQIVVSSTETTYSERIQ